MKSNKLIPSGHKNFFVLFVRTWDQNKFLSNPYQHALALWQKFCEVIIINYQKLIDKHVLKDKMQNEKQLLESCQTKFKQYYPLRLYFVFFPICPTNDTMAAYGLYDVLSTTMKMDNHLENLAWVTLLQNRMIFNGLCYWPFR